MTIPRNLSSALQGNSKYEPVEGSNALGAGSYGQVVRARRTSTVEEVAIKLISKDVVRQDAKNRVASEIINHSRLEHPHVVTFKEVLCLQGCLGIALEYCNRGNLLSMLTSLDNYLSEREARWYFQQIIFGLDYCHQSGVVNRDVKPANVVLHEGPSLQDVNTQRRAAGKPALYTAKLCDFGYSKASDRSDPKSIVGTLEYMAPEYVQRSSVQPAAPPAPGQRPTSGRAPFIKLNGSKLDIWSAGITLFHLLGDSPPFMKSTRKDANPYEELNRMVQEALSRAWRQELRGDLSAACRDLLDRMLDPEPSTRITMPEIMAHPWFTQDLDPRTLAMHQEALKRQGCLAPRQDPQHITAIITQVRDGA